MKTDWLRWARFWTRHEIVPPGTIFVVFGRNIDVISRGHGVQIERRPDNDR